MSGSAREGETGLPAAAMDGSDGAAIAQAARWLAEGRLVAFPTETVYGIGARADDDAAVSRIFEAKGRPADHPLIVHVASAAGALHFASSVPPAAQRLMDRLWPGPLTLILPRAPGIAAASAGGQHTIGVRCPSHPVAQALLRECLRLGVAGVAAPSANRFGRVSPTQAAHVLAEFGGSVPVLDGGACEVGIESSIVDCSRGRLVLLRPGVHTIAELEAAAEDTLHERDADAPRASGTLEAHYAPDAKVLLMSLAQLEAGLRERLEKPSAKAVGDEARPTELAVYSRSLRPPEGAGIRWRSMPAEAGAAAHELFTALREFDDEGVRYIWVEEPPPDPSWDGVRDRLRRAAAS